MEIALLPEKMDSVCKLSFTEFFSADEEGILDMNTTLCQDTQLRTTFVSLSNKNYYILLYFIILYNIYILFYKNIAAIYIYANSITAIY